MTQGDSPGQKVCFAAPMAAIIIPIAFEVSGDSEHECSDATASFLAAQSAYDAKTMPPVQGGDRRWRSVVKLKRRPTAIEGLPDWCAEG